MATFVEDFLAGDALAVAEGELIEAGDPNPDGASIIAVLRDVDTLHGGYYVITGDQVEALSDLNEWLALPDDGDRAEVAPEEALDVLRVASEIFIGPS